MRALHCLLALFLWNCEAFSIIMEVSYKTTFPDAGHSYTGLLISLLGVVSLQAGKLLLYNSVQFALDIVYLMCYTCAWLQNLCS